MLFCTGRMFRCASSQPNPMYPTDLLSRHQIPSLLPIIHDFSPPLALICYIVACVPSCLKRVTTRLTSCSLDPLSLHEEVTSRQFCTALHNKRKHKPPPNLRRHCMYHAYYTCMIPSPQQGVQNYYPAVSRTESLMHSNLKATWRTWIRM